MSWPGFRVRSTELAMIASSRARYTLFAASLVMAVGAALWAPSASAQQGVKLPPEPAGSTPTQLCQLLLPTDPSIKGANLLGNSTGTAGLAPNRFLLQFLSTSQLTWKAAPDNPGAVANYIILRTASNRYAFEYLPSGAYAAPAPISPPDGGTILKTTVCYGAASTQSTFVLPKCEATIPVGVTCSPGFNGVALLSVPAQGTGQRIVETPCTCGNAVGKQCNADNLNAPDSCASLVGPIKEVPDETVIVNGGANKTLYCNTKGSTRTCNFFATGEQSGTPIPKCVQLAGQPVNCADGFNGAVLLSSKAGADDPIVEQLCTCGNVEGAQCNADTSGPGSCAALMGDTQEVPSQLLAVNGSFLYCRTSGGSRICTTITP